jgi:two-component system response regulator AtoC
MRSRILVVDDEPSIRKVLQAHLSRDGHDVDVAADGAEAIAKISSEPWDLVVTDLKMPGVGGLEVLAHCSANQPGLPVIILTAHATVDAAVEALKLGAQDFISKPFDLVEVRNAVEKAVRTERARRRSVQEDPTWRGARGRFDLIGVTPSMQRVYTLVERVADSPTTVLLVGESGTGKELVARALHAQSARRDAPFIPVNCGAIPESLFESELFGYEKGAFTGAATAKPGRFELASGGTLFLDEVGELPRDMQVKLLRALQERVIDRVGGLRPVPVDVRVVAATNVDLAQAVAAGRFREDLYYRLNVIQIRLPPLRERRDDIPLLVDHFLTRFNQRLGTHVTRVEPGAMAALTAWRWPGNIRELENVVERGVLLADGDALTTDLVQEVSSAAGSAAAPSVGARSPGGSAIEPAPAASFEDVTDPRGDALGLKDYVRVHTARLERALIQRSLEQEHGNVTRAARRLEISRKSLQLKMKEYALRGDDSERD